MLMSPHDGAVDHRVFVIAVGCQVLKDALPYPGFGPAAEPSVRIFPVAKTLRQVTPWYSRTVPVQHRLDKATIVTGGCTDVAQEAYPVVPGSSISRGARRRAMFAFERGLRRLAGCRRQSCDAAADAGWWQRPCADYRAR